MGDDPDKQGDPAGTPPGGTITPGAGDGTQATPPPGTAAAAPAPAARAFSQEEVNRIAAQAREEGRQSALKKQAQAPGQEPAPPPPAPNGASNGSGTAEPMAETLAREIARAMQSAGIDPLSQAGRAAGYTPQQLEIARAAYDAAKPQDAAKWLGEWATAINIKPQAQAAPAAASSSSLPRKVEDMRDEGGLIDVFALAPEQVMTMGPQRIREEFEKVLTRNRELSGAPPLPAAMRRK
jgi:hypothetical protein